MIFREALKIFAALFCFYVLLMNPSFTAYDVEACLVSRNLLENGSISISTEPLLGIVYDGGVPGVGGRKYARGGVLDLVVVAPVYAVGHSIDLIAGYDAPLTSLFLTLALGPLLAGTAGAIFFIVAAKIFNRRTALPAAIIYSLGTMALPYSNLRIETLLVVCILTMLLGIVLYSEKPSGKWALVAGLGAGAAIATKSYALILTLPGCLWFLLLWRKNRKTSHVAFFLGPVMAFVALQAAYNALRFGSPANAGYPATFGFGSTELMRCLYVLFLSPAKSIFLFAPIVLIGFLSLPSSFGNNRDFTLFIIAETALLVLFISIFREPLLFADEIWGSRYMFPAVSLLALSTAAWIHTRGWRAASAYALGVVGFFLSLPGAFARPEAVFVYSNRICAAPKYCRLTDPAMNAIYLNAKFILGWGPEWMAGYSGIWTWWYRALYPVAMSPERMSSVATGVPAFMKAVVIVAVLVCGVMAAYLFTSLARGMGGSGVDSPAKAD